MKLKRLYALTRVSFAQILSGIGGRAKKKSASFSAVTALLILAGIAVYISCTYSMLFADQLETLGRLDLLLFMIAVVALILGVMLTTFSAGEMIFGAKDSELLLSLPITGFEIVAARLSALLAECAVITLFMMLPAGIIYTFKSGSGGMLLLFRLAIASIIFSGFIAFISAAVGFALTWLTARLKNSRIISSVIYIAFIGAAMLLGFKVNSFAAYAALSSTGEISPALLPAELVSRTAFGDTGAFLTLLAISVLPLLALCLILGRCYKETVGLMKASSGRSGYRLKNVRSGRRFAALVKKEAEFFFGTPIYAANCSFGLIILVAASIYALIRKSDIAEFMSEPLIAQFAPAVIAAGSAFTLATVYTAAVSVSLERDRLWILKESPISPLEILMAKGTFNLTLTVPAAIISSSLMGIAAGLGIGDVLLVMLLEISICAFCASFGLVINLLFPKLDAMSDAVVVKRSLSSLIACLGSMLLAVVIGGLFAGSLALGWGFAAFSAICSVLFFAAAALLVLLLSRWGVKKFEEL